MKKSILLSVFCCLFGSIVFAQDWVTFTKSNPEAPIINLTQSDNLQVEFTVEVCGMFKNDLTAEGETFQRTEIPGAGKASETGEPELPYIRQLIAIPECDDVILTVNITGQVDFNNYNIYPAPDYEEVQDPNGGVYLQEVFSKDETVYAQNTYLPGTDAEIVSTGYLRGQKYAEVYLYPVQFNPVTQQIDVYTHYQVSLTFTNPTTAVNVNTGIFNNVATNTMLNYVSSGIRASINDNVQGNGNVQWITLADTAEACTIVVDYLIICAEDFFQPDEPGSEVLRIANHRATYNGFDVAILSVENILLSPFEFEELQFEKEQKIRTCIRRIYQGANGQHTYDGKLGYVLLIGDSEDGTNLGMPTSYDLDYILEFPSDYYYSCLTIEDGGYDPIGDLFIGRFCVDNNDDNGMIELHNFVEKTIYFETEYSFEDWRDNVVNIFGYFPDLPLPHAIYYDSYEDFMNTLLMDYHTYNVINASSGNSITQEIIDAFNSGSNYGLYSGHGEKSMWTNNTGASGSTTITELQEGLTNSYKNPVILSIACQTGWFDDDEDCFGEALTTYSPEKGFVGFLGSAKDAYINSQSPITEPRNLQEHLPYSIFNNMSFISGEFILESKINSEDHVINCYLFNYFGDPALNIMAHGFQVTHDIELPANTTISTGITVKSGAQLTIPTDGELFFEDYGCLTIEEGATLRIKSNAKISGNSPNQNILVKGTLILYSNSSFSALEGTEWGGLKLNNLSKNFNIYNSTFENCYLSGESNNLTVSNSTFFNSGIKYSKGDLVIQNSIFDNSDIEAVFGNSESSFVEIKSGCTIQNCECESAVLIDGYDNYTIDDCIITGNTGNGVSIFNSGRVHGNNIITNCLITNNETGVQVYRSYVNIYGDQMIENNQFGIKSLDNSNLSIRGNSLAEYTYETQIIRNNEVNQIFATQNSFPFYIKWNAIIDEDNQHPLISYRTQVEEELDVRNNYWGNNFDPGVDLYPFESYLYQPIWQLNGSGGIDGAEAMYNDAHDKIETQDFAGAKTDLQQIVLDYPTSKFAQAALRELYSLEEDAGDDYIALKEYYDTEPTIQSNPGLSKLADYLINFCEIKLENYPTAISWFENIIQNPESLEDSIFAIIDLGYTYFLIENGGLKSAYKGNLVEHIPESKKQFEEKRDYLLTLLYKESQINDNIANRLKSLKEGELLQNVPNPFIGSTQIYYKLNTESNVQLNVYNYTGQLISTINEGVKIKGIHHIDFDANGLTNGIYLYSISINGKISDSKKMTLMK
ncbi:MAG: hypothetical protein B6D64_04815 [Bacteroidetes bacterium 4484_276]|nr:MAG: hypothetical protein B6D64_04815 [Bacteroidetes bacterium 4484_276]